MLIGGVINESILSVIAWLAGCVGLAKATYTAFEICCTDQGRGNSRSVSGIRKNDGRIQSQDSDQSSVECTRPDRVNYICSKGAMCETIEAALRKAGLEYDRSYHGVGRDFGDGIAFELSSDGRLATDDQGRFKKIRKASIPQRVGWKPVMSST